MWTNAIKIRKHQYEMMQTYRNEIKRIKRLKYEKMKKKKIWKKGNVFKEMKSKKKL